MAGPNWKLEDDHRSVRVTFPTDPPVVLRFGIAGIEEILKNLGAYREVMKPEVPRKFATGQNVQAVPNPIWKIETDPERGDSVLHIRDPRYGWLHYVLPRAEASKLGGFLTSAVRD
jgi:hypothetical protein